ncbi:MAG: branched-chain amino acid ABC transporter permease [Alphaproteobacteria bacterium]|uniref:branched-chain amino acid ABC transporter permease n=1 Tax=Pacificispira sp. TaxID=2888761 RepID=UPI002EC79CCB|nr:branched-chain amino acid ABC transporter permease [Pseudomonadota bacterium]
MDFLLSGQLLFAALVLGSVYAVIALGLNLVYGTMRLLNIAHGEIVMVGAYAAFWGFSLLGLSPLAALPVVGVLTGAIGLVLYRTLFRAQLAANKPVAQLEASSLLLFFGVSIVMQNLASLAFTATPRAYQHLDTVYQIGGVAMTGNRIATLVVSVAILVAVLLFLNRSIYGLAVKALIQHRDAARVVGINVDRVQTVSILAGFGIAGIAGALVSMAEQISPFMGFPFTIASFVVIIMGGLGNIVGGIMAGFLLAFIEIYAVALTSANFRSILIYGIFVGILVLRPQGLLGKARRS